MRGAPQSGFAMLISRINFRISSGTVGRPPRRLDFQHQYNRKTSAMLTNNGVRLHDRQRIANLWKQPIETSEYQTVEDPERESLRSSPPQNVYLLPQRPNLCLERCPRPK